MEEPERYLYASLTDRDGPSCHSETRSIALSDRSMDNRKDFRRDLPENEHCLCPKPGSSGTRSLVLSERSMDNRKDFRCDPPGTTHCPRPGPDSSETKSLAPSRRSMENRNDFSCDPPLAENCPHPKPGPSEVTDTEQSQNSPNELDQVFKRLEEDMIFFVQEQLRRFRGLLASDSISESVEQNAENPESTSKSEGDQSSRDAVLNITLNFLRRMDKENLAKGLENHTEVRVCNENMKRHIQQRFGNVFEGVAKAGTSISLNQIYTELYIVEGGNSDVNQDHEVRHIETASRKKADIPIECKDIFKQRPNKSVRAVLTKGVAGVGKTVLTQKFSLDWAESRTNQNIQLLFPFTFRALNELRGKKCSLVGLLYHFFSEAIDLCSIQKLQVLFIFDGLDESKLRLDFGQTRVLSEPTESASLETLLVNLIRGTLLPSAHLWITTRPATANQIPAEYISIVTEVRGFTNPQREQYFRKRFRDEQQATAVISHIRTIRSLYIMSHLPIFCWMLSNVMLHLLEIRKRELPHTLTQMYIYFLVVQAKVTNIKYHKRTGADFPWTPETRQMVRSLAKLAFEQLQNGNLIFYESDLKKCGLDAAAASVYSGVFTQIFREERGLYHDKVYCFIHLTVQEFMAALHVHQTFTESGINLLEKQRSPLANAFKPKRNLSHLHRSAVDQALKSPNGHLDLFLRFLLGLSLPTNQELLSGLLTPSKCDLTYKTVWYINQKMDEPLSVEGSLNLLHCLNELDNNSLVEMVEYIQNIVRARGLKSLKSSAHWSTLSFNLLSQDLEEFDLRRYHSSEKALLKLLVVVKASPKAILSGCGLTSRSCGALASVLSSSNLTQLDYSHNDINDSGVELLCDGLKSAAWRLHTLCLSSCGLSPVSCGSLAAVLPSSNLTELDLSYNDLQDAGVELLCNGVKSTLCKLHTLRLSGCLVSETGGASLASALSLTSSCLRELDLRYNNPGPSATLLTALKDDSHCSLNTLSLDPGGERFMIPGLRKYSCEFSLDNNTAHRNLVLSKDKCTVTQKEKEKKYPDHRDRFTAFWQVLGSTGLSGRCYWEVTWIKRTSSWSATFSERVQIAVSYRGIQRSGDSLECVFGGNNHSWSLRFKDGNYAICHNGKETSLSRHSSRRVGVFLDTEAGVLSFYLVLSDGQLSHLHTIFTSFTEPVFAGFGLGPDSEVTLVNLKSLPTTGNTKE